MRERLAAFLGDVLFSDLRAHAARDAIVVIAEGLDMLDVGVAVATDDAATVKRWIDTKAMWKPTPGDLVDWAADPNAVFESLIVQPFVLVRPRRRPNPRNLAAN